MTSQANSAAPSPFLAHLHALENASQDHLVHLALVHPEGNPLGDAAFARLSEKLGIRVAHAAVAAEKVARDLEVFGDRMAQIGREAIAAAG